MEYIILHPALSHMWETDKILNLGSNQTSNEHVVSYSIMKLHNEIIEWKCQQEAKSEVGPAAGFDQSSLKALLQLFLSDLAFFFL